MVLFHYRSVNRRFKAKTGIVLTRFCVVVHVTVIALLGNIIKFIAEILAVLRRSNMG